ncbi:hypothetical protein ST37_03295 [Vibrio sp. qd031]|uniref:hypothetical protein n=1 Tax=Vibrio sp. qd031 TaxID=1603038 RepID=UPI000A0FF163|nr:hypothetical protein [Vibrio sp. qd031]ORT52051.1 hypothetical protein ST37_03295 [Vibrio sp. qd031]
MRSLIAAAGLFCWSLPAMAEVETEKFKLDLGGYLVAHHSTQMFFTSQYLAGVNLDLQDDFGMETQTRSIRLDGHYRLNPKHKMEFSYYRLHTGSSKVTDRDIDFLDVTFSAGARIDSYLKMDIYKLNYAYSFYHTDKVELSTGIGLHMIKTTSGVSGDFTADGEYVVGGTESMNFLAPLPVLGFKMIYSATDKVNVIGALDYFGLNIRDFSGYFTDLRIASEYAAFDNVSIGAGLNFTVLDLAVKKEGKLKVSQGVSGAMVYLSYRY